MYVWTVKGRVIEDISIIFDNSSLPHESSDLRIIINRINNRKRRREKWLESK